MELIKTIQLSKSHGTQDLFEKIDLRILEGDTIALVGPNGAGKTSLIKLLLKQDQPTDGVIQIKDDLKIGYVPQMPAYEPDQDIADFLQEDVRRIESELRKLETVMGSASQQELPEILTRYESLNEEFENRGGWDALDRCEASLRALGMDNELDQKLKSLSGGEISLLAFARALAARPDLLILDEPGNHLDYLGLAWLENYLAGYPGTLLVVSHNRYMIDRISRKIWYLEGGNLATFTGKYSEYTLKRQHDAVVQQHEHISLSKQIAQVQREITRLQSIASATYNPKKTILVQLGAAKGKLARLKSRDPGKPDIQTESIKVDLKHDAQKGEIALQINGYSKSFGDNHVLHNVSLELFKGEKMAIVGPNGCGKSTLLNAIRDEHDWNSDLIRIGPSCNVGWLKQETELNNPDDTIEEEVRSWGNLSRDEAFHQICNLQFSYDDLQKKVGVLSGGEKKRLALARLMYQKADFLILDEPTNHMDILSREAIERALEDFTGTLLVVSHDRYFLDTLVHRVVDLEKGEAKVYEGNFSDFFRQKYPVLPRMTRRLQDRGKVRGTGNQDHRKVNTAELEQKIDQLEKEKRSLEKQLSDCYQRNAMHEARDVVKKAERVQSLLDKSYTQWEAAMA